MKIENQKHLFNIPADVSFLNCAYMSPQLKTVNEAGISAITQRDQPWTIPLSQWFEPVEELKELFAKIINSKKENIALIPSASYGIAIAMRNINLSTSQKILVLDQQYPSNIYAWRELSKESGAEIVTVKRETDQTWTDALLNTINNSTGLVAIPNCHWANGGLVDLIAVSEKVREVGAKLVIDASQSIGVYPLDIEKIKPDFLVTVGYKWLLGPYGLSYFYTDEKYFQDGKPIEFTWIGRKGSEDFTKLVEYTDQYRSGAKRFDAGQHTSFVNIAMAKAALTQILSWGVANIQETISSLTNEIKIFAQSNNMIISDADNAGHIIGLVVEESNLESISKKLISNNVFVSYRGKSMRISPHLYNNKEDISRLLNLL